MIPLYGHVSPASAYVVADYPYGFKLRCQIRYWLETDPKRGVRFCSQTTNPKKIGDPWNAPKKSTYMSLTGCMFLDEKNHVQWSALSEYDSAEKVAEFVARFPGACDPHRIGETAAKLYSWAEKHAAHARMRASGEIVFTMNGVVQPTSDIQIGAYRKDAQAWDAIAKSLEGVAK